MAADDGQPQRMAQRGQVALDMQQQRRVLGLQQSGRMVRVAQRDQVPPASPSASESGCALELAPAPSARPAAVLPAPDRRPLPSAPAAGEHSAGGSPKAANGCERSHHPRQA